MLVPPPQPPTCSLSRLLFKFILDICFISLILYNLLFLMITVNLEPRRLSRSSLQKFYVIKTHLKHIIIVLGTTGNAYLISIKPSAIFCNCPDKVYSCKHIIFIVAACGFISGRHRQSYVNVPFRSLLDQLHRTPSPPLLHESFLDKHSTKLCSAHAYSPCFFCALQPATSPPQTLIICSYCGFLCHTLCLQRYMEDSHNRSNSKNICPRCGRVSVQLTSPFLSGYRNFSSILRHRGYQCKTIRQSNITPTQTHSTTSSSHSSIDNNHDIFSETPDLIPSSPGNLSEPSVKIRDI